jgi:hypothetical protein
MSVNNSITPIENIEEGMTHFDSNSSLIQSIQPTPVTQPTQPTPVTPHIQSTPVVLPAQSITRPLRHPRLAVQEGYNPTHHSCSTNTIPVTLPHLPPSNSWMYEIKYMIFSGGGVKGYAYAGSILSLDKAFFDKKLNLYQQLKGAAGTSIGAMMALYIVMGVRGQQLIKEVLNTNITETLKESSIQNLMDMFGLCPMQNMKRIIYNILERFMGKGDITFQELFDITQKQFICCVTNVHSRQPEYHSHLSTPHYKVFESICASMCVPLLYAPCVINGICYVDGGLTDNCPFKLFPINETFIMNMAFQHNRVDLSSIQRYIACLISIVYSTIEKRQFEILTPVEKKRIFHINIHEVSPMDIMLTADLKRHLISKGSSQLEKFINPNLIVSDYMKMLTKSICYHVRDRIIHKTTE